MLSVGANAYKYYSFPYTCSSYTVVLERKETFFLPFIEETKQGKDVAYWIFVSTLLFQAAEISLSMYF